MEVLILVLENGHHPVVNVPTSPGVGKNLIVLGKYRSFITPPTFHFHTFSLITFY
jgi:hypothetical protein